jgi:hypothetical protein
MQWSNIYDRFKMKSHNWVNCDLSILTKRISYASDITWCVNCNAYLCSNCDSIALNNCAVDRCYLYISGDCFEEDSYTCNEIILMRVLL